MVRNASIGDLASIQNAINSAKSGDTVVIPAGQWVVNSTTGIKINNKSNLTIKGEGAGSTSAGTRILGLRPDGAEQTSKGIPAFVVTNATNVTLKDMTVYFGSRTDSGTVGVTLKNTVGAKLEGLYIKEGGGAGIRLDPGTEASQVNKDTVIRDCHIERAGYGLHLRHAKNLLVENCDIHHSTDAVKFDLARDVTDSTFRKNYLHHNERDSMDDANLKDELSGHLERITVEYNIFADNQQSGVEWKNLNYSTAIINDNTFRYNLFLRNPDPGLIMRVHRPYGAANLTAAYSCPNMIYETEVSSNIFYQNGTAPYVSSAAPGGMLILSSCGIAVSNNVFWQNSSVSQSHELTIGLPGSISARIQLNNNYFIDKTTGLYLTTGSSVDTNTNQNLTPSGSTYTQYVALKNTILNGIGSTFLARDPDGNGQTILQQLLLP